MNRFLFLLLLGLGISNLLAGTSCEFLPGRAAPDGIRFSAVNTNEPSSRQHVNPCKNAGMATVPCYSKNGGLYQQKRRAVSLLRNSPRIPVDKAYYVVVKVVTASVEGQPSPDVLADGSYSSTAELNPLRADVSIPPVTFGPKRWELPEAECSNSDSVTPSDELRQDLYDEPIDPETLKAAAEGLAYVWKAFGIASVIVFGGAALIFGIVSTKLEIHSRDDIRVKGRDLIQGKLEMVREQLVPLNKRAENLSRIWQGAEIAEQNPTVKEVSEAFGAKAS